MATALDVPPTAPPAGRPRLALGALGVVALAEVAVLLAVAGRYGYSRDELYFLRSGHEAAWGYVDNPPLTPLVAAAMDALAPGSLVALRVPSALAAGLVVLLTGVMARELGGSRAAQLVAAASIGVSAFLLAVGHILTTSTLDLLAWTALCWLFLRALRDGGAGWWLAAGAVAGLGLENKLQPAFLLVGMLVAVLLVGPRRALRSPWPYAAAVVTLLLGGPQLVWQATHGWPVLELSRALAGGSSGTSQPWYVFLPFQLLLVSPVLVPFWVAGGVRLWRDPALRYARAFPVAYLVLAALFVVTGGKPYYLAGLYPVLLAAGAVPVVSWARRGPVRRALVAAALGLSLVVDGVLFLPVVPVGVLADTPVTAVNYDAGETVGWPQLAAQVRAVRRGLPAGARVAVLTRNYGEAGAIDRFAPELGPAHSGHNAYWTWGPPPDGATTVLAIGFPRDELQRWFGRVELAARVDNGVGLDNGEQGAPIWVATQRRAPWAELWPQLRHLG